MPTKVFAGNLPKGMSNKEIRDIFSTFGEITDANVVRNYAFVHFSREEDAEDAVKALDKSTLSERTINVQVSKNQGTDAKGRADKNSSNDNPKVDDRAKDNHKDDQNESKDGKPTKVFVGNLLHGTSNQEIKDMFSSYGELTDTNMLKNIAFVHFAKREDAEKACEDLNKTQVGGRTINVEISKNQGSDVKGRPAGGESKKESQDGPTKLFVGNIKHGTSNQEIKDLFGSYGELTDTNVLQDYAFVYFAKREDADKAVKDLHKSTMSGRTINVELSKNQGSRSERRSDDRSRRRDDDRRSSSSKIRSRSRDRTGSSSNPLGALAGLIGLGGLGGLQQPIQPPIQPQVQRAPQHEQDRPNPDVRVRKEAVHVSYVPGAAAMGLTDGYVIYERYYVDPNHHLLKEPRVEDARVEDTYVEPKVYDSFVASRDEAPPRKQAYAAPRQAPPANQAPQQKVYDDFYGAKARNDSAAASRNVPSRQIEMPHSRDAPVKSQDQYRNKSQESHRAASVNPYREGNSRVQDTYSQRSQQQNSQPARSNNQQFEDDPYAALSAKGVMYGNYGNVGTSYSVSYN